MIKKYFKESLVLEEIPIEGYEKVIIVTNDSVGLKAIICIHSTALGPTLGGTRIYPYPNLEAAITDVKRLAQGMTYKSAMAGVGFGGGKSVILCHPQKKTPEMLISFAQAVNLLDGLYICAEDVGCSLEDTTLISQHTPFVVGIAHEQSSGDPSPFTAWGTFRGIQAMCQQLDGSSCIKGKTIAIQGLGNVGSALAGYLFWHGASLIVSDIDWEKAQRVGKKYGAQICPAEDILSATCDILSPCALGGIINSQTTPQLRCRGIAGSANNQLLSDEDALQLTHRGILYAPDFVINAGGLINVSLELEEEGYHPVKAQKKIDQIYDQLLHLFGVAQQNATSTHHAALSVADNRIQNSIGKREKRPYYHHFTQ